MKGKHPYDNCPVYRSDRFLLRLIERGDADDLLGCYSDVEAVRLMNADNCTCDFHYETADQMVDCIGGWLGAYEECLFVRFSIVNVQSGEAVGTIEFYDKTRDLAILRLDLSSAYETETDISGILALLVGDFYGAFGVKHILTKAIPSATERIAALRAFGFISVADGVDIPHSDYAVHWIWINGEKRIVSDRAAVLRDHYYVR